MVCHFLCSSPAVPIANEGEKLHTYLHGHCSHIVKMQPMQATNHQMWFSLNKVNICCCLQPLQLRYCWRQPGGNAIFRQLLFPPTTGKPTRGGIGEGLDALAGQSLVVARCTRRLFVHLTRGEQSPKNETQSHLRDVFKCLAAEGLSRNRSRSSFGDGQVSLSTADKKQPI